jgi:uncharacterized protein YjbI with pentapeptide repeats
MRAARLVGADLTHAKLFGVDLCGADLRRANWTEPTSEHGADLHDATLQGVRWKRTRSARWVEQRQRIPMVAPAISG